MVAAGPIATLHADDPAPAEVKLLEGRWKVVELESDGNKAPVEALKDGAWIFKGDEISFNDPNAPGKSRFKVDPAKSPKEIDIIGLDGPQKGKALQGIYRLVDGKLTICIRDLAAAAKGRPTEFVTKADSGLGLIVLEKAAR
jgi:uncharacterized protein (TIGR03067 family)